MERVEITNFTEAHLAKAQSIADARVGFTEGCRVLFLIQRHSDGGATNNSKLRSYITRDTTQWVRTLAKLIQEKEQYPHLPLRIYQTVNARNIEKGIREFKIAMLNADYYDTDSRHWFYLDAKNRIVSAIMQQNCRATSFFLFDVDDESQSLLITLTANLGLLTNVVMHYPTKKGHHIITEPFNPNLIQLPKNVEYKKDAMMLLDF